MTRDERHSPVIVSTSTFNVDALIATFDRAPELRDSLQRAQVLIIPSDLGDRYEGPAFPTATRDILAALHDQLPDDVGVEAAVLDDDYITFDYHSVDLLLPELFIVSQVLLPLVLSTVGSWIANYLSSHRGSDGEDKVKHEMHVALGDGRQAHIKYDGPAATYEETMTEQLRELGNILHGGDDHGN